MSGHPYDRLIYGLPIAGMDPDGSIRQGLIARCAHGGNPPIPFTGVVWDDDAVTVLPAGAQALYAAALAEARALHEVNGIRGDIGLEPLEHLQPAVLDQSTDEPADDDPITLSIVADAPDGWACEWVGWDRIDITGPEEDPIHLVVPGCVDLHLAWGRGDMPTLTIDPPALVPYTVTPRFGEQLSLLRGGRVSRDLAGGAVGDASHSRWMVPVRPTSRRRCPCCKKRATHVGVAGPDGVALMEGCEWLVRLWVKEPARLHGLLKTRGLL